MNRTVVLKVLSEAVGFTLIGTSTVPPGAPLASSGMANTTVRATTLTMPLWATDGISPSFRSCWVKVNGEDVPAVPTAWKTIQATCTLPLRAGDVGDSASANRTVPETVRFGTRNMSLAKVVR